MTARTRIEYGVTWIRHIDDVAHRIRWVCGTLHPVTIERDSAGQYTLFCDDHGRFATVWRLRIAFRMAAVHMGYCAP